MQLKRLALSTFEPVSVKRAKDNSNIADSEKSFDGFFADCIASARDYIERQLGCCLCLANYTLTLNRFPANQAIEIPIWPVAAVASVAYKDIDNAAQVVDLSTVVQPIGDDRYTLLLNDWLPFPATRSTPNAVTISFSSGWPSQAAIPPTITRAILMLVSFWFENRETVIVGSISKEMEFSVTSMLESVRQGEDYIN